MVFWTFNDTINPDTVLHFIYITSLAAKGGEYERSLSLAESHLMGVHQLSLPLGHYLLGSLP
jgi:hypothetical protein